MKRPLVASPAVTGAGEWTEHYDENEDRAPREMLLEVLDAFGSEEPQAVDLGCGSGIETLAMLERGWSVFAIDAEEEAILRVRKRVASSLAPRLRTLVSRMEGFELPRFEEEEKDGDACSGPKHWHVFHAVARRP